MQHEWTDGNNAIRNLCTSVEIAEQVGSQQQYRMQLLYRWLVTKVFKMRPFPSHFFSCAFRTVGARFMKQSGCMFVHILALFYQ
jgi:hypothetical protein